MAAATIASAMPVLPDVGSTMMVWPGVMSPSRSAASIIDRPMRSLTEPPGLKLSSLATTVAPAPSVTLLSRTSGVPPMRSESRSWIGMMSSSLDPVSAYINFSVV